MSEDTYLKDNIKKCVDYLMSKDDDVKRRIITGMFEYNDYLLNEQLVVQALNDKEKLEWFNNEMFDIKDKEIERLNNIINELEKWLKDKDKNALQDDNYWEVLDKLQELRRIYE